MAQHTELRHGAVPKNNRFYWFSSQASSSKELFRRTRTIASGCIGAAGNTINRTRFLLSTSSNGLPFRSESTTPITNAAPRLSEDIDSSAISQASSYELFTRPASFELLTPPVSLHNNPVLMGASTMRNHLFIDGERRRLKTVRMFAMGITLFFMIGSATCMVYEDTISERSIETSLLGGAHRLLQDDEEEDEGLLESLRDEFKKWVTHHRRDYDDDTEHNKRFHIWKDNHFRTIKKNEKHGHCKMTKQPVFGSNHFKDLSPEEFQTKYLTGYNGPKTDELKEERNLRVDRNAPLQFDETNPVRRSPDHNVKTTDGIQDPIQIPRHHSVQERYLKHVEESTSNCFGHTHHNNENNSAAQSANTRTKKCNGIYKEANDFSWTSNARTSSSNCAWYDVSCILQRIFQPVFGTTNGSSESQYNQDSYPTSMDWRQLGAVTDVHSQGSCGACWAITAVETIESAHYIKHNVLLDLSETEIIVCDDTCEMCNGGWPQNAYDFVMNNGGALLANDYQYDGDVLMTLSEVSSGQSDAWSDTDVESYLAGNCPGSDNQSSFARYGNLKSYAYATDRCTCYTDGSGCDCDEQNEALAVRNLASYGPATICLDASVWQDYQGGILSDESGCSAQFLNMNHCVQAVGYAFTDLSDDDNNGSNSHSSDEDSIREGYWIVRNQWSSYWGMNGYIYIAMGSNTCGVLNDMTQVFMD